MGSRIAWALAATLVLASTTHATPNAYFVTAAGSLVVVDTATNAVTASIPVAANPYSAIVNATGSRLYTWTPDPGQGKITVVDVATSSVVAAITIAIPYSNHGIAVHPSGSPVYFNDGVNVTLIDATTNLVPGTVPLGKNASHVDGVAVTPDGARVYAATTGNPIPGMIRQAAMDP